MSVQHRFIAHQPDSACGVSVFLSSANTKPTVVVTELPDNPGVPVGQAFAAAANKVARAYLKGLSLDNIDWVYRQESDGRETLVHLRLSRGGEISSFCRLHGLGQLIGEKSEHLDIPPLLLADIIGPPKHRKIYHEIPG